ncbi:MAG: hypothetical protein Tsb0020_09400 [Haliangiales bacterium]
MKVATIDNRKGRWIIGGWSQTVDGAWIQDDEYYVLDEPIGIDEVVKNLMAALSRSRLGIPHPQDFTNHMAPLLNAAGVRSWRSYVNGTKSTTVKQVEEKITLTPMANHGPREGFSLLNDRMIEVAAPFTTPVLGQAILQALAACE